MQFDSLQDFLAMGGYALYVWLSFGVSLLALVWVVIDSAGTHKKLLRNAREEQARQARIAAARKAQAVQSESQQTGS
ncbi:MAG: heme exporter protein CcmD [Pseudomonadota bacterium]|uniref:Heme exporter protein D n=1 Tax=Alteromonas alba TaxID=2079529 RepID=A0A2S9VBK7_9ALTE|nr:heme exporter protein CcmD [Alteromonas alba]MAJ68584.1 heme exporter protein CcmD [Alteromonadaceae bacterium]MCP4865414.1 heme exporter protein CcmD [Alteromonas sp.]MDY6925577.1 heme exporter protein CcmD [Pseudomonadota bacterium]RPH18487.1 MAG: heme exporter protein CcmD [Alteromonadaceae bacterium TMED7]PRO73861.1 heme exporter protein CcmD [Alteromonas alba]|tara:strand:+ start:261 stop:491 length:231 start_codon:yes stop_codon:yes gene_type:complete